MMPKCTIYLIRHGESKANVKELAKENLHDVDADELGSDLTEKGIEQAKNTAKLLKSVHFDALYASDYIRAVHTARYIAEGRNLPIIQDKQIREINFGSYRFTFHLKAKEVWGAVKELPESEKMKYRYADIETEYDAMMRLKTFVLATAKKHPNKTIAIVCHGRILRLLLIHLGFCKYDELPPNHFGNAGFAKIESDGNTIDIKETYNVNKVVV